MGNWGLAGHTVRPRRQEAAGQAFEPELPQALQIDPRHKGAHEYLGEAYLQTGDLDRAEQELRALDSICFLPCEQYTDLKEQVRRYKTEHATSAAR